MNYKGYFEPNFLYKNMHKSAAEYDAAQYRALLDALDENGGSVDTIAGLVRYLHHYIYDRAGIHIKKIEDEPRLPLWFAEKPAAAEAMYKLIEMLPADFCTKPYFHHVYLAEQAQNCFIIGDWGNAFGAYARLLSYTADLEKFAADAKLSAFDALEFRCKMINNACVLQVLSENPEGADMLREQFKDNFNALRREYDALSNSAWREVYDMRWQTINDNTCFFYHTMPGGRPYFRELTAEEENSADTAFWWILGSKPEFFIPSYPETLENGQVMLYALQPADEKHLPRELYRMAKITPPYVFPEDEELPDPAEIK